MMGFDGTTVTPQIKSLITEYHIGSILLSAKNLKCTYAVLLNVAPPHAEETAR